MPSSTEKGRKRSRNEEHMIHPDLFAPPKRPTPPVHGLCENTQALGFTGHPCGLNLCTPRRLGQTTGNTHCPRDLLHSNADEEFDHIIGATLDPCDLTHSTSELGPSMGAFCDPCDVTEITEEVGRTLGANHDPCDLADSIRELERTMGTTGVPCDLVANSSLELEQTMGTTGDPCELANSSLELDKTMGTAAQNNHPSDVADSAEDCASTSHPYPTFDRSADCDDEHSSTSTSWDEQRLTFGQPFVDLDYLLQASDYELGIPSSRDGRIPEEDMTWLDSIWAEMQRDHSPDKLEEVWTVHVADDTVFL